MVQPDMVYRVEGGKHEAVQLVVRSEAEVAKVAEGVGARHSTWMCTTHGTWRAQQPRQHTLMLMLPSLALRI